MLINYIADLLILELSLSFRESDFFYPVFQIPFLRFTRYKFRGFFFSLLNKCLDIFVIKVLLFSRSNSLQLSLIVKADLDEDRICIEF